MNELGGVGVNVTLAVFSGMQQSGTEGGSAVSLSRASTPACAGLADHNP